MSEPNDTRADLPRVVVDTNQLLLGMFQRGLLLPIFQAWIRNEFVMITSSELLDELGEVIARPKFQKRITKPDAINQLDQFFSIGFRDSVFQHRVSKTNHETRC